MAEEWGVRTYYASDDGQVIAEFQEGDAAPTTPQCAKNYIYLGGRLLATQTASSGSQVVQYHHPDRLGTRLVTNAADSGSFEQVSLPYGVALGAESTGATNRRFTSYERSGATGLDYAVNRHYDSLQGRFTQVDPIGAGATDITDPQTWNMYAYCGNDPINQVDPDGLFFKKLFKWVGKALKWIAIAAAVATVVLVTFAGPGGPLAGTLLAKILGFVAGIPNAIGGFVAGAGKTIAGVFSLAEAGVSAGVATAIGNGVLLGGSAAAGALANLFHKEPSGKTIRRQQKEARRQERERIKRTRVRLPPGISTEPPKGAPTTGVPEPPQLPGVDPENPRLPDNASRSLRIRLIFAQALRALSDYFGRSPLTIMGNPEAVQDAACRENPNSDLCINGPFPGCCQRRRPIF